MKLKIPTGVDSSITIDVPILNKAKEFITEKTSKFMGGKESLSASEARKALKNRNAKLNQQLREGETGSENPNNVFESDYTDE